MYNGVGLQTPRGSGTSGFVQRNYSVPKKVRSKLEFLKELKALRENVLPPPRKANQEIQLHKQQREIYVKQEEIKRDLREKNLSESEIQEAVDKAEKTLKDKFDAGDLKIDCSKTQKDSHALAEIKEQAFNKVKNAFEIEGDYNPGEAFDFESQQKKRQEKLYAKEINKMNQMEAEREKEKKLKVEKKDRKKNKYE